ncbi:hypothetical protein B484DRAFT_256758 [Ochromonadaceae sp. CCMP2298]|nr:hypothetical protein B484DRAFT_256758 [Ochromonadaceae sp. CCMP2298]
MLHARFSSLAIVVMALLLRCKALLPSRGTRIIISSCRSSSRSSSSRSSRSSSSSRSRSSTSSVDMGKGTDTAGVYLHIPFCRRRCHYCDFPIQVIGDRESTRNAAGEQYTDLLVRDIKLWSEANGAQDVEVDSVYFGGGTPSLLPDKCVQQIMDQLRSTFRLTPDAEVTLEMDPGTFNYDRLKNIRSSGVNRISMGVQSFDAEALKKCGRAHTPDDTARALEDLHRADWQNFSIDLISSLPFMSTEQWADTLRQGAASGCSHISVYDLQIEDGTAFGRWYTPGVFPLPTEEAAADMYRTAVSTLGQANFEHYEVSNYALPGHRSRHNQKYWRCAPVYAFGMSAASYLHGDRFSRPSKMPEYKQFVADLSVGASTPTPASTPPTSTPDVLDVVMLSLRTADGLDLPSFTARYGESAAQRVIRSLRPYASRGLVEFVAKTPQNLGETNMNLEDVQSIRLVDPDGFLVSNDIISSVFAKLS